MNEPKQNNFVITDNAVINVSRMLAYTQLQLPNRDAHCVLHFDDGTQVTVDEKIGNAIIAIFRTLVV